MKNIIKELDACTSYSQKYKVLKKYGKVHRGSSRMCLIIGNKVIKVARNNIGYLQNECEYNVYFGSDKKDTKHLAKIYDWHSGFSWIIQEKIQKYTARTSVELYKKCRLNLSKIISHYDLVETDVEWQMGTAINGIIKCYDYGFNGHISIIMYKARIV